MKWLGEKISTAGGFLVWLSSYLLLLLLATYPLSMCPLPWWADFLIIAAIMLLPDAFGGILTLVVWAWSFIIVISGDIGLFEIIYFVLLAVYVVFFLIPGTSALISAIVASMRAKR